MYVRLASFFCLFLLVSPAFAKTITSDTTWSGKVMVEEDLLVAGGATLTIAAGTKVLFAEADSTKTDPAFWSPNTEIAVNGKLIVEGTEKEPVTFEPETGYFGGIIAAPGSEVIIRGARIARAEEGLLAAGGTTEISDSEITGCETGIVVNEGAAFKFSTVKVSSCKIGAVDMREEAGALDGITFSGCADACLLSRKYYPEPQEAMESLRPKGRQREFVGDYTVEGSESWNGVVTISGRVTVPPGSSLNIEPGTRVRFRKKDTDGDGLGEGELLVTGSIKAAGTEGNPIVFESAEDRPAPGDWDKVSVISSEASDNLFENTVFRHGVQALHGHFSNLTVKGSYFTGNLRAVQFQESEKTLVTGCTFIMNKQAVRFRDSSVTIENCFFSLNDYSVHAFRGSLDFRGNKVHGSKLGGILAKECSLKVEGNLFDIGRNGLKVRGEGSRVSLKGNKLTKNVETALSLSHVEGTIAGNEFDQAGLDLVGIEESKVVFRENRFGTAGRHSMHLNGPTGLDAAENYWKTPPGKAIWDKHDDPSLGLVTFEPAKEWGEAAP